jgi:hypothetical protein
VQPLHELIQYLESEKETLTRLINESLSDHDYLSVHHHSQALYRVEAHLKTLYNLEVPAHDAIISTREGIERLRKHQLLNGDDKMSEYCAKLIRQQEEKLQSLDTSKKVFIDTQELDDCLYGLIVSEIYRFTLHLIRADDLFLTFKMSKTELLQIAFGPLDAAEDLFAWNLCERLKTFGFTRDADINSFVSYHQLKTSNDILDVKEFLARLVFDCFYIKNLDNPASLEVEWTADR